MIGNYNTLVIVGNGFDMAHGFNTDYKSFAESTSDESMDVFKECCDSEDISTWYLFEINIEKLTHKYFIKRIGSDEDNDSEEKAERLRESFENIHYLLIDYLKRETTQKPMKKIGSIEEYLNRSSIALTFNYTDVIKNYTPNVIYVHGSIKENDIILGYDYRDEPCLAGYDDMRWSKSLCREGLAFRRYLQSNFLKRILIKKNGKRYKQYLSDFELYASYENGAKGICDEDAENIHIYRKIKKFKSKYCKLNDIPKLNYERFKTIVVLGHGIEADTVYLESIIKKCTSVSKVVIFRHDGESDQSFNRRKEFFLPYCKNVVEERYQ